MKHDKTFEAIAKLQDIEIELRRLKTALEITNKALDAAVLAERNACVQIIDAYRISNGNSVAGELAREWTYIALKEIREEIRARGDSETNR